MKAEDESTKQIVVFNGFVKHSNGNAIDNLNVVLSEQLLRDKNKIAETNTDQEGFYKITIDVLPEITNYILDVIDEKGKTLVSSNGIFNPEESVTLNLTVSSDRYKGETAFRLRKPVMKKYFEQLKSGKDIKPLSVEDVFFVANQTKQEPRDTFHWLRANEMESETKISAEVFYGIFKQGLPTHHKSLSSKSGKEIKEALLKAAEANFISDEVAANANKIIQQWNTYIIDKALDEVPRRMDASLSQVLGIALNDKKKQKKVLTAYLDHDGSLSEFWSVLDNITGEKSSGEKFQIVLKLGVLSANQPDVMEALMNNSYKSESIFHELAAKNKGEWVAFVNELSKRKKKSVVPVFIKANYENDRVEKYARQLEKMLEKSLPTHSFFGKLANQNPEECAFALQNDLVKFFTNNPSFDLKKTSTNSILDDNSQFNFEGIDDKDLLADELQSIQRLSSYTTDFNAMSALNADGMNNAYKIVSITNNSFIQSYSQVLGSAEAAQRIYQQAGLNLMYSAMVWTKIHPNLTFKTTTTPAPISDPTLRTMFGTLDACECRHCTSVYSPAAYYTDILRFLYSRTPEVYNELVRRRPDLVHIELSCENTNRPLPYVDLVNELLENFVQMHKNPSVSVPDSYQTTWQAKELAANPEHINYDSYKELKKAVYPNVLPFNLPVDESRVYLKHLGVQSMS